MVCPVTLTRKENTGIRMRKYWWVSRSLMTARKITLVLWDRTRKKTVAKDRAGIKHLTLKFRGPVGLGKMNKWWKNRLLKEHRPKSRMFSSHVVMVCYCCWYCQEELAKKRGPGSDLLHCPGRSRGQNGISHSHWTKYINSKLQRPKQFSL